MPRAIPTQLPQRAPCKLPRRPEPARRGPTEAPPSPSASLRARRVRPLVFAWPDGRRAGILGGLGVGHVATSPGGLPDAQSEQGRLASSWTRGHVHWWTGDRAVEGFRTEAIRSRAGDFDDRTSPRNLGVGGLRPALRAGRTCGRARGRDRREDAGALRRGDGPDRRGPSRGDGGAGGP